MTTSVESGRNKPTKRLQLKLHPMEGSIEWSLKEAHPLEPRFPGVEARATSKSTKTSASDVFLSQLTWEMTLKKTWI